MAAEARSLYQRPILAGHVYHQPAGSPRTLEGGGSIIATL